MDKNLFQKLNNHRALGGPAGELGPDTTNCSVASISALRVRVTGAQHPFDYARTSDGPDAQTQRSRPPAVLSSRNTSGGRQPSGYCAVVETGQACETP